MYIKNPPLYFVNHEYKKVIFLNTSGTIDIEIDQILQKSELTTYEVIICKSFKEYREFCEKLEQKKRIELLQIEEEKLINPLKILELADKIKVGSSKRHFEDINNSIYIPKIGNTDVYTSISDLRIKEQNYIQVCINEKKSNAIFVASFLNSELGLSIRNLKKKGPIPVLSKERVSEIKISIPSLSQQQNILNFVRRIDEKNNELICLSNSLDALKISLIDQPDQTSAISKKYKELTKELDPEGVAVKLTFDDWIETLPFPLAAILREYLALPTGNRHRFRVLLRFFEAAVPYITIIYFGMYADHKKYFNEIKSKLKKDNFLNFKHLTLGIWIQAFAVFRKYTESLLKEDFEVYRKSFNDDDLFLLKTFSDKKILFIFQKAGHIRNDWAHASFVSNEDSIKIEEELMNLLKSFRKITGDIWTKTDLIKVDSSENLSEDNYIHNCFKVTGSNPTFKAIILHSRHILYKYHLYLVVNKDSKPIKLFEFLKINPPSSEKIKNASYFFNGLNTKGESKFISHHFSDSFIENSTEDLKTLLEEIT